jgi:hypothetical protein
MIVTYLLLRLGLLDVRLELSRDRRDFPEEVKFKLVEAPGFAR